MKRINYNKYGKRSSVSMSDVCHSVLKMVAKKNKVSILSYINDTYKEFKDSGKNNFSSYLQDKLILFLLGVR